MDWLREVLFNWLWGVIIPCVLIVVIQAAIRETSK